MKSWSNWLVPAVLLAFSSGLAAADVLRVGNWNMGNLPNSAQDQANLTAILGYIGSDYGALDVMALAETDGTSAAATLSSFDSTFGGSYASVLGTADDGGDRTGFVYNTDTLSLVNTMEIGGLTHPAVRGQFRPAGTSGESDLFVYAVHLKSGDSSGDEDVRLAEAGAIRADADALGPALVLYLGDFNWSGADERGGDTPSAWDAFAVAGEGQGLDPAGAVGDWRDNAAFLALHTQDPGGAMDDRFDMQIASSEFFDAGGLEYLAGSYRVIGNNGTHDLNGLLSTGTGGPTDLLTALSEFDHLPVVASYGVIPEPAAAIVTLAALALLHRRRSPS